MSAQYRFGTPLKGYSNNSPLFGGSIDEYGWMVDVGINAKNSYGGYGGETQFRFLIKNGVVSRVFQLINGRFLRIA